MERGGGESLMFLVDFGEDNWEHAGVIFLQSGLFSVGVVGYLGEGGGKLG